MGQANMSYGEVGLKAVARLLSTTLSLIGFRGLLRTVAPFSPASQKRSFRSRFYYKLCEGSCAGNAAFLDCVRVLGKRALGNILVRSKFLWR